MSGAELSKEEQELFDQMRRDDGAKPDEAKGEDKSKPEDKPKQEDAKQDAKTDEKKDQKVVPLEALSEARAQNKELRKELDAMKAVVAEGDKKLQALLSRIEGKVEAGPDFQENPAGHLKHENEQLRKGLAELQDKIAKQEQAGQQNAKLTEHSDLVKSAETAFAKEHPDYNKAAEYVAGVWREEFSEAGFEDAELPKLVFSKALGITTKAVQTGKNPAETIYKIAKRYGFAAQQDDNKKAGEKDGESKLKQIEKGLEAAKSAGGGSGPDEDAGLAGLAQMTDEELEKRVRDTDWWNRNIRRSPLH